MLMQDSLGKRPSEIVLEMVSGVLSLRKLDYVTSGCTIVKGLITGHADTLYFQ